MSLFSFMITKKTAKIPQHNAPEDKCFWLSDGKVLRNLSELANALAKMDGKVFKHHVDSKKNDFAAWVKDVFGQEKLATDIKKSKTAASMAKKIQAVI